MYDKVKYVVDLQPYMYETFLKTDRGRFFLEYNKIAFAACIVLFMVSLILLLKARFPKHIADNEFKTISKYSIFSLILAFIAALFFFYIRNNIAFVYMDFSYFFEGEFTSISDFFSRRVYITNIHRPGYHLISFLVREFLNGSRDAFILINLVAMVVSAPAAYRLLSRNMSKTISIFALVAYIFSPITMYSVFRISPYSIIAAMFILLVYSYDRFRESGERKFAVSMALIIFALPFFHILTAFGLAVFFLSVALGWKEQRHRNLYSSRVYVACIIAFAGTAFFNLSLPLLFHDEIVSISSTSTTRMDVYVHFLRGNLDFLVFCLKTIPNLYLSFLSQNPITALVGIMLFIGGGVVLARKGSLSLLIFFLGIVAAGVLFVTSALNHKDFHGFVMSYRHLHMASFFFIYVVFFAGDIAGRFLSSRTGTDKSALCLILLIVYLFHVPAVIQRLKAPEMIAAMEDVYSSAFQYDGIIPGNIYFMNDYHEYFLSEERYGYSYVPVFRAGDSLEDQTISSFNKWINLDKPGGEKVRNLILSVGPFSIASHKDILKCNFIQRIWYFDNDTRFMGVMPDFSGGYKNNLRESLEGMSLLETREYTGVDVKLFSVSHPPLLKDINDTFNIRAGENDYYFVRGTIPDTRFFSSSRTLLETATLLFYISEKVETIKIEFLLDSVGSRKSLIIDELAGGKSYSPVNDDILHPVYLISRNEFVDFIHIGFRDFDNVVYREILLSAVE